MAGRPSPRVVTVLAVHPTTVASTRLRASQYGPSLEAAGFELRLWSFFRPTDLVDWFGPSQGRRALAALRSLVRLPLVVGAVVGSSVVLVQREAIPFGPPLVELLAGWRRRLVWDVDDSIWVDFASPTAGRVPRWIRATGDKYGRLCRRADEVWAGSEYLAAWCRAAGGAVVVVPTVVDVPEVLESATGDRAVGWIGSHSTVEFLDEVLPALAAITPPPRVVAVGGVPQVVTGLDIDARRWSEPAEAAALAEMRVGLYPVDTAHPLADGKCGFKAILYMAHGIPPVVTPTVTNAHVVRDGVEGLHATDAVGWTAAVGRLLDDEELWARCRTAAHERARTDFSLAVWGPRLAGRLGDLVDRAS